MNKRDVIGVIAVVYFIMLTPGMVTRSHDKWAPPFSNRRRTVRIFFFCRVSLLFLYINVCPFRAASHGSLLKIYRTRVASSERHNGVSCLLTTNDKSFPPKKKRFLNCTNVGQHFQDFPPSSNFSNGKVSNRFRISSDVTSINFFCLKFVKGRPMAM